MAIGATRLAVQAASDFETALGLAGAQDTLVTTEEWDDLLREAATNVVFLTWQWQRTWWQHFGAPAGSALHLLVLRDGAGSLAAIAPLCIERAPLPPLKEYRRGEQRPTGKGDAFRLVRFVGGTEVADYLDIIARPGEVEAAWTAVFDYLEGLAAHWDALDFHCLPQASPSRDAISQIAAARGLRAETVAEDVCPVLRLPGDWETYLMSLRKKDRHELRRKVRKLEGHEDARWHLVPPTDHDGLMQGLEVFLRLHRLSGPDKAEFMDEAMTAFFTDTVDALAPKGWVDIAIMEIDGHPAAAYFSFNYGSRLYLYNSGYDPAFGSYSAGIALLAYRIHKAINQGTKVFDFLRGDEPYKYDFGGKDTFVYRILVTRAEGRGNSEVDHPV